VLAQTDADTTDDRFPVAVYDGVTAKDVDLTVQFKPVSGKGDQGAGLVWRYRDPNNYYITRCNALEDNCTIYHVINGRRQAFLNQRVKGRLECLAYAPRRGHGGSFCRDVRRPEGAGREGRYLQRRRESRSVDEGGLGHLL